MKNLIYIFLLIITQCFSQEKKCLDKNIKIVTLSDIDKLIKTKYVCDFKFETFGKERLDKCVVLFSDRNYKVVYDQNKTRLLFDKKLNLIYAIVCISPDFKLRESIPNALYILDNKLMPLYSISKSGEKEFHVFKYEYINDEIIVKKAIDSESNNINIDKLSYPQIIKLTNKIKNVFTYKNTNNTFDDYFFEVPLWTEGYR